MEVGIAFRHEVVRGTRVACASEGVFSPLQGARQPSTSAESAFGV